MPHSGHVSAQHTTYLTNSIWVWVGKGSIHPSIHLLIHSTTHRFICPSIQQFSSLKAFGFEISETYPSILPSFFISSSLALEIAQIKPYTTLLQLWGSGPPMHSIPSIHLIHHIHSIHHFHAIHPFIKSFIWPSFIWPYINPSIHPSTSSTHPSIHLWDLSILSYTLEIQNAYVKSQRFSLKAVGFRTSEIASSYDSILCFPSTDQGHFESFQSGWKGEQALSDYALFPFSSSLSQSEAFRGRCAAQIEQMWCDNNLRSYGH